MQEVPTTGAIKIDDVRTVFELTGETKLSTLIRGGGVIPDIPNNATVPNSSNVEFPFSSLRGATKGSTNWEFNLKIGVGVVKYNSATSSLKLNAGTEMQFVVVQNTNVFDNASGCYALRDTISNLYLNVATNGIVSMKTTIVNNDPTYSFKVFSNDGGVTYRVYCSSPIVKTGSQQTDAVLPYKNAWLAYNSGTDTIYAASWSTLSTTVTEFSFITINGNPIASNEAAVSAVIQEFPVKALTALTTTISGYAYGNGTYTVTRSRDITGREAWRAFDYITGASTWQTTSDTLSSTLNDWVQIQLPFAIRLNSFGIDSQINTVFNRTPATFRIEGIRVGETTLNLIGNYSKVSNYKQYMVSSPANNELYNRIRLTITTNTSLATVTDLRLFATW
jgi:hypothetical protein|uniref:Uncharacterized protein n=1 Tax=viral metagenome TaxID=1070528 RepID=A0A6C0BEM7_9ZZZZ